MHKYLKNKYNVIFCIEFILFINLAMLFVPTNDDLRFAFYSQYNSFAEFIHQTLYYGNGRLLGNGLIIFFSKHPNFFYPLEAILIFVLASETEKLTELKNSKLLVAGFLLLQPILGFRECIAWMSAFINYYIPIFLLVSALVIIKYHYANKNKAFLVLLFIIGFSQQLFIEHNTIINLLISGLILFVCLIKKHRNAYTDSFVFFISNIIGTIVMLTYSLYIDYSQTYVAQTASTYRKTIFAALMNDGLIGAVTFAAKNIKHIMLAYGGAVLIIGILYIAMAYIDKKSEKSTKHRPLIYIAFAVYGVLFIFTTYVILKYNDNMGLHDNRLILILAMLFSLSLLLTILLFCKTVIKNSEKETHLLFFTFTVFAVLSFAPFLLVSPCGYRCTVLTQYFMILITIHTIKLACDKYAFRLEKIYHFTSLALCTVMILYIALYAREKKIYNYKAEYFKSSYYLPSANRALVSLGDTEVVWDDVAGFEHKYIPLEEFEKIFENN